MGYRFQFHNGGVREENDYPEATKPLCGVLRGENLDRFSHFFDLGTVKKESWHEELFREGKMSFN